MLPLWRTQLDSNLEVLSKCWNAIAWAWSRAKKYRMENVFIALFAAVTQSRRRCRYLTQQKTLAARLSNVRTQSQSRCRINQINCGNRMQRVAAVLKCWKGLEKLRFAFCLLQLVQLHNKKTVSNCNAFESSTWSCVVSCFQSSIQFAMRIEWPKSCSLASQSHLTAVRDFQIFFFI